MEDHVFYSLFERTVHLFKICLVKARHPNTVAQLKDFSKEFLTNLVPYEEFFKTVSKFQQYITIVIIENVFKQDVIMSVIEVLDMFEQANQKRSGEMKIKQAEFYNDALNKDVDLKK